MDTLVNCYNETLRSVLDIYAPVLTRDIIVRSRAPWFNEDIRKAKHARRRAEKKWRTTRLPADLAAFKKERNRVVNLMNEARRVYYNQFIEDNITDQRRLFMATKSLLNMHLYRSLPPHTDSSSLANDITRYGCFCLSPQVTYLHTKIERGLKFFISNFASLSWRIALKTARSRGSSKVSISGSVLKK